MAVHSRRAFSVYSLRVESSPPPSPAHTSWDDMSHGGCTSMRRAHSEGLVDRFSVLTMVRPTSSLALLPQPPPQHPLQLDRPRLANQASRCRRQSGGLSVAAHASLIAVQNSDDAAAAQGSVDEEDVLLSHGSNTSSSSQTRASRQRLARLDTTAWQIAYHELKFSRLIGEGSFGRVFLGKWRETTVAIKLLTPSLIKPEGASRDSDSDCELGMSAPCCKCGLLDDLDREASIMAALRHPNVVMFLGVCLEPPCMVAEVTPPPPTRPPAALHLWEAFCLSLCVPTSAKVCLCTGFSQSIYTQAFSGTQYSALVAA